MTEQEWLASGDPAAMLAGLQGTMTPLWHSVAKVTPGGIPKKLPISDRKLRLFACACCIAAGTSLEQVDEYEANGMWTEDTSKRSCPLRRWEDLEWAQRWVDITGNDKPKMPFRAAFLRDIVGNPWRPLSSWIPEGKSIPSRHYGTVLRIAQVVYDGRRFDEMPILADALEDAGCDNADVLMHCRGFSRCPKCNGTGWAKGACNVCCGPGWPKGWQPYPKLTHVRGCWVLDLLLGLE